LSMVVRMPSEYHLQSFAQPSNCETPLTFGDAGLHTLSLGSWELRSWELTRERPKLLEQTALNAARCRGVLRVGLLNE
jgi:hypothetical protein